MSDHLNSNLPSDRSFGLFFGLVFLGTWVFFDMRAAGRLHDIFGVLALLLTSVALLKPRYLRWCNIQWMRLGLMIGFVMNPIILAMLFYLVFTPFALVFKLVGRDELNLRFKKAQTYWVTRKDIETRDGSFTDQF